MRERCRNFTNSLFHSTDNHEFHLYSSRRQNPVSADCTEYIEVALINALSGAVEIMRSLESRKYGASSWRLNLTHGIVNIAISVLSLIFVRNTGMLVYMYSLGLFYFAIMRIIRALRRTAIVYVS